MMKHVAQIRGVLVILMVLTFISPGICEWGNEKGRDGGHGNWGTTAGHNTGAHGERRENRVYYGGDRHYYRDGRWYRHGWFGFDFIVSALVIGSIIDALPASHTTVIVGGIPYYYDDTYYYREIPEGGYVVVPPPVMIEPLPQSPDTTTVNIPNSRGGYTSVTLTRSGSGYVGPQGEFYPAFPSVEQLKTMYGG